jgi:hypothetical protein
MRAAQLPKTAPVSANRVAAEGFRDRWSTRSTVLGIDPDVIVKPLTAIEN